jgi:glycosyltransferase involved in cell wall biosynthesis
VNFHLEVFLIEKISDNLMTVDIVIPTYKRYGLLQETLTSVVNQSYPHWKCWISEDGESKETFEAVKPFLKDNRFTYLPGTHAGFPAVPRNRGIRQGVAKYVALLDDDDLWLPQKLDYQVDFLKSHPNCVLLGCNAFYWEGKGTWEKSRLYFRKNILGKIDYTTLLRQDYIIHSSAIVQRAALEQSGLYNEELAPPIGEDYELWLRIGALGEIWVLPEPYVVYRQTPLTFYSKLDRNEKYKAAANIFESALKGAERIPSPLSYPENEQLAAACRRERDFYLAGPRFLGRFRHEMQSRIKHFFHYYKKKSHE